MIVRKLNSSPAIVYATPRKTINRTRRLNQLTRQCFSHFHGPLRLTKSRRVKAGSDQMMKITEIKVAGDSAFAQKYSYIY